MAFTVLHYLCLATLLSHNLARCTSTDDEEPKRTFPFRRAIDGTRGRKFYEPEDDGFLHSYGSSGRYDPDHQVNDFSDIRNNVPGEPGVDYPSYTRLPQTGFVCEAEFRGYYADESAGCQVFHVCDGSFLVSSFLCPMGSIFSQKLLTCDWWTKVDCSATRSYHVTNSESLVSEADDDDILRKAFEMSSVRSAGERIPVETVSQQQREPERQERRNRVLNYGTSAVTERTINELQTGADTYSDYPDYPSRAQSRFQSRNGQKTRQRYRDDDYYSQDVEEDDKSRNNPQIRIQAIVEDRRNDRTFVNEFQPSYAPTVPTVITTTRRFYSPTFPTTYRPSTEREGRARFDLEFESSDHLYNARGRSDETVKAATVPSVATKLVASTEDISLAILVNSADETRDDTENMQQSESSYYRTTVTIPDVRINGTKAETSTEPNVVKERSDDERITETFSILTIDNENRNPDIFAYNREDDARNETNVEISASSESDKKSGKIAAFLQPPKEANQFRIMVLEESAPKSHEEASESEGLDESNSDSLVEIVRSIEIPATRITPPLFHEKEATRESRVIRIFVNKDNDTLSTEKTDEEDLVPLVEDSEGEHSETRIVSEVIPREQEEVIKNSTSEAQTVLSTRVSSDNATGSSSKLDNSQSIDVITAAVALEESGLNAATEATIEGSSVIPEEKKSEDNIKLGKISLNSNATVAEEKNNEDNTKLGDIFLNSRTTVAEEKKSEDNTKLEEISLNSSATVAEEEKSEDNTNLGEVSLNSNATVAEEKNFDNYQKPSGSEITLDTNTTAYVMKSNENSSVVEGVFDAKATVSEEKNESVQKVNDNEETVRGKTTIFEENRNEQSGTEELLSDAKITDTVDQKSPDFQESEGMISTEKPSVTEEKNDEGVQKPSDFEENTKTAISQEKSIEDSIDSEAVVLDAETVIPREKISEEHSIGSERTLLNAQTAVLAEKSIERSIDDETILLDSTPIDSKDKISDDHERSIGKDETLLNAKTVDFEAKDSDNHERSSRSDEIRVIGEKIEDTVVEGSSPFQVTLTVNKDHDLDPNGEVIRKLIAKQEIGDSVAAADYRRFDIVKSDESDGSKGALESHFDAADSRNARKIESARDTSEERLSNFQSNGLQSTDYYRNLVALVNGPNVPRPFSLEPPRNVEVRTPSDIGDAGPSPTAPFDSEIFRNDLAPASSRNPAQASRQSIISSLRESESLGTVSSTSSKAELANNEKIVEQPSQTFGERQTKVNKEKLAFELPQAQRSFNFRTGLPLEVSQRVDTRGNEESEESRTTQRSNERSFAKTVVETEFIPSISFSLNTDEEREEYMEAVIRGLLPDVRASEATNNDTNTSIES